MFQNNTNLSMVLIECSAFMQLHKTAKRYELCYFHIFTAIGANGWNKTFSSLMNALL